MSAELIQLLQFLLLFISILLISYGVIYIVKRHYYVVSREVKAITAGEVFEYIKNLTVRDYECYHRYEIWRIYRYS